MPRSSTLLRKFGLIALLACSLVAGGMPCAPTRAEENPAGQVATLKETLEKGLKARLPSEFKFIHHVVALVNHGSLSREMVLSTFSWSLKKNERIPFPYFQFAMRAHAKELGVNL
jgi:hypothetical protein